MIKILCPIDLSPASVNAMKYAANIASKSEGALTLLHIKPEEVTESAAQKGEDFSALEKDFEADLKYWAKKLQDEYRITCEWKIRDSLFEKEIIQMANEQEFDLIVMGTEGKKSLEDRLFGSLTYKIVEEVTPPVLVVPADLKDHQVRKVIYSSNYDKADVVLFRKVLFMAQILKADLTYFHVSPHAEFFGEELFEVACDDIQDVAAAYPQVEILYERMVDDDSVDDALEHYLEKSKADLVVMVTRHRNMFQKLFHKSVTKKLTLSAQFPLLIFHREKELKQKKSA